MVPFVSWVEKKGRDGSEDITIEKSEMMNSNRSFSDLSDITSMTSADSKSRLNSIIDAEERSRGMELMMARLEALQIQQKLYGMNHPDVLFSLKHLGRAHTRRGEFQQARLIEEMVRAGQLQYNSQENDNATRQQPFEG
jgi:hypothetical protein